MFLIIIITLILLFECIYYVYFISANKQEKIEYYRDIPSNENPAIVGLMIKGNVDGNDIIATILDLLEKEYIDVEYKIINGKQKYVIKDAGKDRFLLLKDYENYLLDELFKDNQEVILEDFINSSNFEIIFKNVGNMIKKRVALKSVHKISHKKIVHKINLVVNFIVLGFSIFFPFFFLLLNNFYMSVLLGYLANFVLLLITENVIFKLNYRIEHLLFSYSIIISIFYFGILLICYLLSDFKYQSNIYLIVFNIIISILFIFYFFAKNNNRACSLMLIDYGVFVISFISMIMCNKIGMCICIIYFSNRIYLESPNHTVSLNSSELEKWEALRRFLNDFSIIRERNIQEISIWNKYLIYAISMGVNKKVISEYVKLLNIKLLNQNIIDKYYIEKLDF